MNRKGIIAVLGVVVVILIGTTVYFVSINRVSAPVAPAQKVMQEPGLSPVPAEQKPVQSTTPVVQPADETADWKTYKNEKYGFEFKYPNDWIELKSLSVFSLMPKQKEQNEENLYINLQISENSGWAKGYPEQGMRNYSSDSFTESDIKIDGVVSKLFSATIKGEIRMFVVLRKQNSVYEFSAIEGEKVKKTFNLILSTFKFTK